MAYPKEYQDAEHRRALGALMNDLEALVPEQADTECCAGETASADVLCSSEVGSRKAINESHAEIHLRTVKRIDTEVPQESAN